MKKIVLIMAIFLLSLENSFSQPVLEGKVKIEGRKEFAEGALIKSGTEIIIEKDSELVFKGKVESQNIKKSEIKILGKENSKISFEQAGVNINYLSVENLGILEFIESNVNLKNVKIERAKVGLKVTKNTTGFIENLNIRDSEIGFVTELKAKVVVLNSTFNNNQTAFIADQAGVAEIKNSNFFKNNLAIGVNLDGGIRIFNSNIYENEAGITFVKHIGSIINENTFKNNKMAIYAEYMTNINIEKNQFLKNDTAVKFYQLVNGKIRGNNFSKNREALWIEKKSNPDIRYNTFTENKVGIFCDFSSYPTITLNNFLNNDLHIKLGIYQSADFENTTSSFLTQMQEMLTQQSKRLSPKDQKRKRYVGEIFAKKNYWDEKTRKEIDTKENVSTIYDGYDMGEVSYEGFGDTKYKVDTVALKPYLTELVKDK
ncbi:MAG: hypothetical protein N2999_00460 [Proteobacteria bacterium]|nr:hypothetical protein [Pseudomonadota bacterium]